MSLCLSRAALAGLALALISGAVCAEPAPLAPFRSYNPTPNRESFASKLTLARVLQQGGLIVFVRHARTDGARADMDPVDLDRCDTQRVLSEAGREQAKRLGDAWRALRVPTADVVASPFCRTRETAEIAFGRASVDPTLRHLAPENAEHFELAGRRTQALLAIAPPPGCNRVLVAHGFSIRPITGWDPAEGEMIVFEPQPDGDVRVRGRLTTEDLAMLASLPDLRAAGTAPAGEVCR
ncbi:MAG: histidine phosphatase family protein [Burkholderiales bacterium]|nr:histidine phosphatase family protein [Burkholderiales bacterium]